MNLTENTAAVARPSVKRRPTMRYAEQTQTPWERVSAAFGATAAPQAATRPKPTPRLAYKQGKHSAPHQGRPEAGGTPHAGTAGAQGAGFGWFVDSDGGAGAGGPGGSGAGPAAPASFGRKLGSQLFGLWYLPIAIFYFELVFKASTAGRFVPAVAVIALFSVAAGLVLQLLSSLTRSQRANRNIKMTFLCLLAAVFGVEYFVYQQFNGYFDVATVTQGAGDATGQFQGTIAGLLLSPSGLFHIFLFVAPYLLYLLQCKKFPLDEARRVTWGRVAGLLGGAVALHLVALLVIQLSGPFGEAYAKKYNFQTAVTNYGLLTGVRRDVAQGFTPSNPTFNSNTAVEMPATSDDVAASEDVTRQVDTSPNVMDIDFDALDKGNSAFNAMDEYVSSLTPSNKNEMTGRFEGYNLIFISAEAFSAEAIDPTLTPTLYRLANKGIQFTDYYQFETASTTGGECQNVFGFLSADGGSSVKDTVGRNNYFTMGSILNREGYNGWAFHNNTYTYYSRDETHNNLGYNNGFMGYGNGMEQYVTWQWPQSDLEMMQGTFDNIYGDKEPFNVYYMSVSGHSGYSRSDNSMSLKHWDEVAGLDCSDPVKAYKACQIELDAGLEYLVNQLEQKGLADHTVIVISADHYPYGLDDGAGYGNYPYLSELYGYEVTNVFQRDHNRLIIWSGSLEDEDPIVVDDPVSSIDVLPTLCNLFGVEWDSRLLPGRDVFSTTTPLVYNLSYSWKTDKGLYEADTGTFWPNDGVTVPDGYVDQVNDIVENKLTYTTAWFDGDYFGHIFGPDPDVQAVHDEAVAAGGPPKPNVADSDSDADASDAQVAGERDRDGAAGGSGGSRSQSGAGA